jgi:hypothetical protein
MLLVNVRDKDILLVTSAPGTETGRKYKLLSGNIPKTEEIRKLE